MDLDGVAGRRDPEACRPELDEGSGDPQARSEVAVEHERLGGLDLDD